MRGITEKAKVGEAFGAVKVKKRVIMMLKGQELRSDLFDEYGRERLTEQFGTLTLEGFGCEGFGPGLAAAGAVGQRLTGASPAASCVTARL